ncbi:transcriptional regulator/sugar kinase [Bellilinea caldifistulae]|uniref:ROK family protein n=1 Tax=Bellilinea caldifistulae TaxID=360411 RepID=UPI0007863A9E|nr:ROK family protein [Bellilinea caldifistulae]GAP11307.1 transcriptional regulator/sugar kinase [Bellilinea caldifistulae]
MDNFIVADIGGTQIRVALFSRGRIDPLKVRKIRTRDKEQTPLERLIALIKEVWADMDNVRAICVAVPGFIDAENGLIIDANNIPGWVNYPIRQLLAEHFSVPILIGNDANLAALGEWRYGAGQGHHHLLYLTISTGIGGGVIINDQLLVGARGLAAEFGHITIIPEGPTCSCGQRGHLEAVASGTAIARWVQEKIALGFPSSLEGKASLTAREVAEAAHQGDELALRAMSRAGTYIGYAIADFLHLFNPSIVILGGGVSTTGPLLIDPLRAAVVERIMDRAYLKDLTITTAQLGDNAGLVGALALAESGIDP